MNQRIIMGIALLLAPMVAGAAKPSHPVRPPAAADPHAADFERAKAAVANRLKGPSSVQWKDVHWNERTGAVCGWYNAKNGFGGYVGFKRFTMQGDRVGMWHAPQQDQDTAHFQKEVDELIFVGDMCPKEDGSSSSHD